MYMQEFIHSLYTCMVLILDGKSEHVAHASRKLFVEKNLISDSFPSKQKPKAEEKKTKKTRNCTFHAHLFMSDHII